LKYLPIKFSLVSLLLLLATCAHGQEIKSYEASDGGFAMLFPQEGIMKLAASPPNVLNLAAPQMLIVVVAHEQRIAPKALLTDFGKQMKKGRILERKEGTVGGVTAGILVLEDYYEVPDEAAPKLGLSKDQSMQTVMALATTEERSYTFSWHYPAEQAESLTPSILEILRENVEWR